MGDGKQSRREAPQIQMPEDKKETCWHSEGEVCRARAV